MAGKDVIVGSHGNEEVEEVQGGKEGRRRSKKFCGQTSLISLGASLDYSRYLLNHCFSLFRQVGSQIFSEDRQIKGLN